MSKVRAALAVGALAVLAACVPQTLKTSVGDGSWVAGQDIKPGTWSTGNTGPHTATVKCEWTVVKKSNTGAVLLRGVDTDSQIQTVYVGLDEVLKTSNCGTWGWLSKENLTPTPSAI